MSHTESDFSRYKREFIAATCAAAFGELLTLPFDTTKVTMQVSSGSDAAYRTVMGTMKTINARKGFSALYGGFSPAVMRGCIF